ncbi:MAG: class I SAM-dependent methyltransferase [Pseudomonadota bacterium]
MKFRIKILLKRLLTFMRAHSLIPARLEYRLRVVAEKFAFSGCLNVHELPPIFHYWSQKHLAPEKFHQFGISDPEQFFFVYAKKFNDRFPGEPMVLLSIGSGNCDMEVRLAKQLLDAGITAFTIECLDFNKAMLARGLKNAQAMGVAAHIVPVCADFNRWQPARSYDVVIANQCLHHVLELENLFALIKGCLNPDGYFLTSDMIGRNGHQRWPEALKLVQEFWQELPDRYRQNQVRGRHEPQYIDVDCSTHSFEGIRAQDILPLLVEHFHFELFIPFSNLIMVFIDRPFGHNFNEAAEWDRNFIDRVHARDEQGLLSGELTPTQMLAVLRIVPVEPQLLDERLTPQACIRRQMEVA